MRPRLRFPWFWVQLVVLVALVALEVAYFTSTEFPPWGVVGTSIVTGVLVAVLGTAFLPGVILSLGINQMVLLARPARVTSSEERQLMAIEAVFLIASLLTGMLTDWVPVFVFSVIGCTITAMIVHGEMTRGTRLLRAANEPMPEYTR